MYKAVIFDFGNVLCAVERENFVQKASIHAKAQNAQDLLRSLWGTPIEYEFETGKIDSREYFRRVQTLVELEPSYSYEEFVRDNPDGERALETAASMGARTFVLSNTSFLHASVIFDNEVLGTYPELYIFSYKIGAMKPDPRIWMKLFEYIRLDPRDCLYIDDIADYCKAAQDLGMDAFCYDFRIHNLPLELENMLQ